MRDKRPVDELSIEELERILAIKKREARQQQLDRLRQQGRIVETPKPLPANPASLAEISALTPAPAAAAPMTPAPPATIETQSSAAPQFEDELDAPAQRYIAVKRERVWFDRVLLAVEIAAVVGIVVIALNMLGVIQSFQQQTAAAQREFEATRSAALPTIAPTPSLRMEDYVLPGGHTVDAAGRAQFNYAEVPSHLLPLVQSQWVQPVINRPAPTSETALSIAIPKLNLSQAIVQGVDWEALKQGVGQLPNGAHPGDERGNVVLAAHNDIYGELFRHLDRLTAGDEFTIQTQTRLYTYRVTDIRIVAPTDTYVLGERDGSTVTLISCYPYQVNDQRIVVFADRIT